MTTLVPRATGKVRGVRLKKPLTAAAGDWLILHDDDRVEVLSADTVSALYDVQHDARRGVPARKLRAAGRPEGSAQVTILGKRLLVSAQLGRALVALARVDQGHGAHSSQVARHLDENDVIQVSARLSDAVARGLASGEPSGIRNGRIWRITNEGHAVVVALTEGRDVTDAAV
jgi:hypothetical protein